MDLQVLVSEVFTLNLFGIQQKFEFKIKIFNFINLGRQRVRVDSGAFQEAGAGILQKVGRNENVEREKKEDDANVGRRKKQF